MQVENGLENVVAAETRLSHVDGAAGHLIISGHTLDELIDGFSFEDVVGLLLRDYFPAECAQAGASLADARQRLFARLAPHISSVACMPVFDAMRALLARVPDGSDATAAFDQIAAPAVALPMILRLGNGNEPIAPNPDFSHAEDMLAMAGYPHSEQAVAGLNTYLISVIDHGLNASTFTARVVASTQAGLTSCVLAALGALKGPLHGGAPGPVLDMFDAIGTADNAAAWIESELASGRRLMGFGHRIYRVRDPRADALKSALVDLHSHRLHLAAAIEQEALTALSLHKRERKLETNVEFYTAVLLDALGFPREAFTCVFAAGRVAGWVAHAREQAETGRLIRPQSRYAGPVPKQAA